TLTGSDGPRSLTVAYRDLADNVRTLGPFAVTLDTHAPATAPFAVAGTLADGTSSSAATATTGVTLDFSGVTDASSSVVSMKVSNSANLADATEQPFVPALAWTLTPGDGPKTV